MKVGNIRLTHRLFPTDSIGSNKERRCVKQLFDIFFQFVFQLIITPIPDYWGPVLGLMRFH